MAYYQLLLVAAVALCVAADSIDERNKFILYHSSGNEVYNVSEGVQILQSSNFDNSKKTVIYIHGYVENKDSDSVQTIVSAYRERDDYNFLLLDWHEDASGNYILSLPKLRRLADVVAKKLLDMVNAGLNIENLHLVGHSLGGQMAGRIGKEMKSKSGGTVELKRITALDPAFPGFYGPLLVHISKSDAEFVDIIHTDARAYGAPVSTGHADFWPNGGVRFQPGCPHGIYLPLTANDLCSHWRSWRFWAESVRRSNQFKFYAVSARNWSAFKDGRVGDFNEAIVMGNDSPTNLEGDYYLQTFDVEPFARGNKGVIYNKEFELRVDDPTNPIF